MSRSLHDIHVAARQITARHTSHTAWSADDAAALVRLSSEALAAKPSETAAQFCEAVNLSAGMLSAWRTGRSASWKAWPDLQERLASHAVTAVQAAPSDLPGLDTATPTPAEQAAAACKGAGLQSFTWSVGATQLTVYGAPIAVDLVRSMSESRQTIAEQAQANKLLADENAALRKSIADSDARAQQKRIDRPELAEVRAELERVQERLRQAEGELVVWKGTHDNAERNLQDMRIARDALQDDLRRICRTVDTHSGPGDIGAEYYRTMGPTAANARITSGLSRMVDLQRDAHTAREHMRAIFDALDRPYPELSGPGAMRERNLRACDYIRGLRTAATLAASALLQTANVLDCKADQTVAVGAAAMSEAARLAELLEAECAISCDLVFALLADDIDHARKLADAALGRFFGSEQIASMREAARTMREAEERMQAPTTGRPVEVLLVARVGRSPDGDGYLAHCNVPGLGAVLAAGDTAERAAAALQAKIASLLGATPNGLDKLADDPAQIGRTMPHVRR